MLPTLLFCHVFVLCAQSATIDQFDRLLFVTVTPLVALILMWAAHRMMHRLESFITRAFACFGAASDANVTVDGTSGVMVVDEEAGAGTDGIPLAQSGAGAGQVVDSSVAQDAATVPLTGGTGNTQAENREALVAAYRLFLYRLGLVMLFAIYPGLSTEIVKSYRWAFEGLRHPTYDCLGWRLQACYQSYAALGQEKRCNTASV